MDRHQLAVLTVAGSDSGGNAGIQADIRAFHVFGLHACTVVTALTAQNPYGVRAVMTPEPAFVARQLDAVLEEYAIAAAKTPVCPTMSPLAKFTRMKSNKSDSMAFSTALPTAVADIDGNWSYVETYLGDGISS